MHLKDIALVNIPAALDGPTLRGRHRLLRDLVAAGLMMEERAPASERLQSKLGRDFTGVLQASLTGALRPRRAA